MATKLMVAVLMAVVVLVGVVMPAAAAGGEDDELVQTMLVVRETGTKVCKAMDKFYVPFCAKSFLALTRDGTAAPTYCTIGVARQFVVSRLNKTGTSYAVPRGWTEDEFVTFVVWVAAQ